MILPYNAQARRLRHALDAAGLREVSYRAGRPGCLLFDGDVERGDVPRSLEFLFSRNRLNVAISRAQCLAYLVASPRLLDASCRTIEQMRLANALCTFVELAESG